MKESVSTRVILSMNKSIAAFFIVLMFGTASLPNISHAQSLSIAERNALIMQINELILQINELQALLAARQTTGVSEDDIAPSMPDDPYDTVFYSDEVEAIYKVERGELVSEAGTGVRIVDLILFDIMVDTIGEMNVREYIDEFRVFDDEARDIGAFVEIKVGTDEWIVGVNRDTYEQYNQRYANQVREIYEDLYIHEYAHILAYYNDDFTDDFTDEFWSSEDFRHSDEARELSGDERFDLLEAYYEDKEDEFVTDYATILPDEDVAETFVEYVLLDRLPTGDDIVDEKIRFFDDYTVFIDARDEIRDNLNL
ncbi:MAG: hypothetical protein AAGA35_02645 [Patescibacteria group bacterium]